MNRSCKRGSILFSYSHSLNIQSDDMNGAHCIEPVAYGFISVSVGCEETATRGSVPVGVNHTQMNDFGHEDEG